MVRNLIMGTFAAITAFWSYQLYDYTSEQRREIEQRDAQIASLETDVQTGLEEIARKDVQIERQAAEIEEQAAEIDRLELARQLLRLDHRVATIEVLRQGPAEDGSGQVETEILFTELDDAGDPIADGEPITIKGTRLYLDGLVIKFEDDYVEQGDHLRGTSVCLFERLFSDSVAPENGVPIDSRYRHPLPFRGDDLPDPLYGALFERIWDYANDPEAAAALGVRAISGEAPSIEARPGKTYRVELRQSGGMTIRAD